MAYTEFVGWLAFAEHEPLPERRADIRHAQHLALLANVNRDPKRGPAKATEFLIDWWPEQPAANDVLAKFRAISERINAQNQVVL